jgi:hypothetical protein
MSNQVKQLELDFGMLTVDQQETVDRFVSNSKRNAGNASVKTAKIEELLISSGFRAGIDYVNNLEVKTITEDKEFGYGDNEFTANVTYVSSYGGCQLITERYDSYKNELTICLVSVGIEHDKLECSITPQYRAYKPSTLFTKLKEYNASELDKFTQANKEKMVLDYTVEKYKTLFPNAEVTVGNDYYRNRNDYTQFPIVFVKFESGSWLSFRLGYEVDKEYTHKKFDINASLMTAMETLTMFNNQEAI